MSNTIENDEIEEHIALVARAFSPSSPITTRDLFAGRQQQMWRVQDISAQKGQHAIVYGERGVGKTSLARVCMEIAESTGCICAYYTCSSDDTFGSIWRRVLDDITFTVETQAPGFRATAVSEIHTASQMLPEEPSPDDVRRVLEHLGRIAEVIIYVDEFDRPIEPAARLLFADLVKILSDRAVPATLVLIGVAGAVGELLGEHESIGRSLIQVQMPLMDKAELIQIVESGMTKAKMSASLPFVQDVAEVSQGLPHYTHLIAQHGARYAVEACRLDVRDTDFREAVRLAVGDASQSVREMYHRATHSNRETLYREVLLACAMAQKNDLGEFGSAEVRRPLHQITGLSYEIPTFSGHLNHFSDPEGPRGGVLTKLGTQARFRY